MTGASLAAMSNYEQLAWRESLRRLNESPSKAASPASIRKRVGSAKRAVSASAGEYLPVETLQSIVSGVMNGTLELTFNPALRTADAERAFRALQKKHRSLDQLEDLKQLDVRELDRFRRRKGAYVTTSAVQGAGTSLAVTGSVVSTTVSAGVASGTVVAAVALDTVASLAVMGRSVGAVAVRYGYDVRLPEEELFAMGVLSLGVAGSLEAKHTALAALSRLSQQMMSRATWKQLNEQVLVRTIARVYQMLGLKLTQRKLAQVVPFVGVGINAALSANMTRHVYQRAEDVYRVRFLSEKYGLDPLDWVESASGRDHRTPVRGEIDVAELLQEELGASEAQ